MKLDRLSQGEKIAAVSAILLFVLMFFDWFSVEVSTSSLVELRLFASAGGSAWGALEWIPIFLVVAIVAALFVATLRLTDAQYRPPLSGNAVVAVLGGLSFLLILYRILDPPGAGSVPGFSINVSPTFWIFASLVAAAGIAYGGYRGMGEEGTSFGEVAARLGRR